MRLNITTTTGPGYLSNQFNSQKMAIYRVGPAGRCQRKKMLKTLPLCRGIYSNLIDKLPSAIKRNLVEPY